MNFVNSAHYYHTIFPCKQIVFTEKNRFPKKVIFSQMIESNVLPCGSLFVVIIEGDCVYCKKNDWRADQIFGIAL